MAQVPRHRFLVNHSSSEVEEGLASFSQLLQLLLMAVARLSVGLRKLIQGCFGFAVSAVARMPQVRAELAAVVSVDLIRCPCSRSVVVIHSVDWGDLDL